MTSEKSKRNVEVIQQLHIKKSSSTPVFSPVRKVVTNLSQQDSGNDSVGSDERSMAHSKSTNTVSAALANENKNALWLAKRPILKAFLHHVIMLLELLPFGDYDAYIREMQATIEDCLGTQRYKRAVQAAHHIQRNRRNVVLALPTNDNESVSHAPTHSLVSEMVDRTVADGKFFWEYENLRNDDPQLKALLFELASQTCHARSVLQVEAKLDRLVEGYFTLRVRTYRSSIALVIGNGQVSDPQRCVQFFDLFAINYFNSDTFNQFPNHVHPVVNGNSGSNHDTHGMNQTQLHSHHHLHPHLPPQHSTQHSAAFLTASNSSSASLNASGTYSPTHRIANNASNVSMVLSTTALSPQKKREARAQVILGQKTIV
jgi:hypothetical protein